MSREFTIVMRDGERFTLQATSPSAAESTVIKSNSPKYNLRSILVTYEIKNEHSLNRSMLNRAIGDSVKDYTKKAKEEGWMQYE